MLSALKKVAIGVLGSGLRASWRVSRLRKAKDLTVILNLHRVSAPDGSAYRPLNPRFFEELIVFLSQRLPIRLLSDEEPGAAVVLSFDDGYKDFLEVAVPIMAKHGVKANQNIIPECLETGHPPLNVLAQDFVGKAPTKIVSQLDIPGFVVGGGPGLAGRLSTYIKYKPMAEQRRLANHILPQLFAWDGFKPTAMMGVEDVRQVAAEHEIGAHSFSHASMGVETLRYLAEDVQRCREYFQNMLDLPMDIYAFPNGSCSLEQVQLVKSAGVRHVLLVGEDFSRAGCKKRFTFDASSSAEVRFRALGATRKVAA